MIVPNSQFPVDDGQGTTLNALNTPPKLAQGCPNCCRQHDTQRRELCLAFGKICRKWKKRNHFAVKCRRKSRNQRALTLDKTETWDPPDDDETFTLYQSIAWMTRNSLHSVSGQAATLDFRWIQEHNVMSYQQTHTRRPRVPKSQPMVEPHCRLWGV